MRDETTSEDGSSRKRNGSELSAGGQIPLFGV